LQAISLVGNVKMALLVFNSLIMVNNSALFAARLFASRHFAQTAVDNALQDQKGQTI